MSIDWKFSIASIGAGVVVALTFAAWVGHLSGNLEDVNRRLGLQEVSATEQSKQTAIIREFMARIDERMTMIAGALEAKQPQPKGSQR